MRLSVIVPSLTGDVPSSLRRQVEGRADIELVVVRGVSPVGKARNEGLRRATGAYVAWVDSDDEVTEDWLAEILRAIGTSPDAIVFGYTCVEGGHLGPECIWEGEDLMDEVLKQNIVFGALFNKVLRRDLWSGVRFDDTARTMEDWEVWPRLLVRVKTVWTVGKSLYRYVARAGSLTHQVDESMQREVFERALGRIAEMRRLGLWKRYRRCTLCGVAQVVYGCAEDLALRGEGECETRREAERWLRRQLPKLMLTPARRMSKAKWVLAAFGGWGVVRWYYVHVLGDRRRAGEGE